MTINAAIVAPITKAERARVLAQFPELSDPNYLDTKTANDHIESWVRYWRAMGYILNSKKSKK